MNIDFRKSNFILPEDKSGEIIMISTGSGIAPFIGFLYENLYLVEN